MYSYYVTLLELLKVGIPYDAIMKMDEDEINMLLTFHTAILEIQQEQAGK